MAIADTITSMTTHLEDAYTSLENLGTDTSQIDRNLENLSSEIDEIYDALPKVTAEGTDLELSNTKKGKLVITPKGNSSQFSTTGKNLLPTEINAWEQGSIEPTTGNNTSSTTRLRTIDFYPIQNNTNYYISVQNTSYCFLNIILYDDSKNYVGQYYSYNGNINGAKNLLINIPNSSVTYIRVLLRNSDNTSTITASEVETIKPQIELGSTKTNWEPYTGGIPAPNPSYPYPVKTVTGENSLVLQNENLLNLSTVITKKYVSRTTGNIGTSDDWSATDYILVSPNTDYIYSGINNSWSNVAGTAFYDNNKNFISAIASNVYSFTTPNNTKYIRISLNSETPTSVMLVKGSTATEYVEHREQLPYSISLGDMELCKVGDYQDYIYGNPNHWYKKQVVGKVVLNGSENWYKVGASYAVPDEGHLVFGLGMYQQQKISAKYYCDMFKYKPYSSYINTFANQGEIITDGASFVTMMVQIKIDRLSGETANDFKAWLSSNNMTVYKVLWSATDVQITDETLISQLNNIYNNAYSYKGTTNITTTYAEGNEQMIIDASALKSWEVTE